VQKLDYDTNIWFDLEDLDPSIQLELRYATTNNFVQEVMYDCGRCFLRREVAKAVIRAHQDLQAKGYGGLKMFDCYRPRPIQWKLWEKVPNPDYVADPRKGSMHNRGAATDLTIVDKAGQELEMGTEFDFFGKEAHHDYTGHSAEVQANRDLLKATMDRQGFRWIRTEWWHYSYRPKTYEISDMLWDCE
jgi:D-alanyl-D-alanine dipeptidase